MTVETVSKLKLLTQSDVFKDPIRVSDGAFLLEVSSTGDFVVELRISPNPL